MRIGWSKCPKCFQAHLSSESHKCEGASGRSSAPIAKIEHTQVIAAAASAPTSGMAQSPNSSAATAVDATSSQPRKRAPKEKFDRAAYQRELMRKRRAAKKAEKGDG